LRRQTWDAIAGRMADIVDGEAIGARTVVDATGEPA
jgi:hypothetical protein